MTPEVRIDDFVIPAMSCTEDAFAFEFGQEQVTVGPGQQKEVEIRAMPTSSRPFSSPKLYVFTISVRSIQSPSLVASSQAQIEQKPMITPTSLAVAALLVLVAFFWFLSRPQPPKVDALSVDPPVANEGGVSAGWLPHAVFGVALMVARRSAPPANASRGSHGLLYGCPSSERLRT